MNSRNRVLSSPFQEESVRDSAEERPAARDTEHRDTANGLNISLLTELGSDDERFNPLFESSAPNILPNNLSFHVDLNPIGNSSLPFTEHPSFSNLFEDQMFTYRNQNLQFVQPALIIKETETSLQEQKKRKSSNQSDEEKAEKRKRSKISSLNYRKRKKEEFDRLKQENEQLQHQYHDSHQLINLQNSKILELETDLIYEKAYKMVLEKEKNKLQEQNAVLKTWLEKYITPKVSERGMFAQAHPSTVIEIKPNTCTTTTMNISVSSSTDNDTPKTLKR